MTGLHKFPAPDMHGTIKQNRHQRFYIEHHQKPYLAWADGTNHQGKWVPHFHGMDTNVKILTFSTREGALSYCQEQDIQID